MCQCILLIDEPQTEKICIATGSRADYGLLSCLIKQLNGKRQFITQLVVAGSHLSERHGMTTNDVLADGHPISAKIHLDLEKDSAHDVSAATSKALVGFVEAFRDLTPDLIVVLGDRYEILSASIAARLLRVPICHIHGGEVTSI